MNPFIKTSGGKGLPVHVPVDRRADFDEARALARQIADAVAGDSPDRFTTEQRKSKRRGRLYIDVMRNAYGQTAVAPYAVRAFPGAPVATPLDWGELDGRLRPERFTLKLVPRRAKSDGDPWSGIGRHAHSLAKAENRLAG